MLQPRDAEAQPQQGAGIDAAGPFRDLLCLLQIEGEKTWTLRVAGKPVLDLQQNLIGYRGTATDITSEVEAQRQLQLFAQHDPLTKFAQSHGAATAASTRLYCAVEKRTWLSRSLIRR